MRLERSKRAAVRQIGTLRPHFARSAADEQSLVASQSSTKQLHLLRRSTVLSQPGVLRNPR
jgi:hypothetical protein